MDAPVSEFLEDNKKTCLLRRNIQSKIELQKFFLLHPEFLEDNMEEVLQKAFKKKTEAQNLAKLKYECQMHYIETINFVLNCFQ